MLGCSPEAVLYFMLRGSAADSGTASRPQFAWHPSQDGAAIIALAAHGDIFIASVTEAASQDQPIAADSEPQGVVAIGSFGGITSLSFSADGDRLAAVSSDNEV